MKTIALLFVSVSAAVAITTLAGCSAGASDVGGAESNVIPERADLVSGFDFEGPKSLPAASAVCNFFQQPEEDKACAKVGGTIKNAEDCALLCTKPIARPGQIAGYDFSGYKQGKETLALCSFFKEPDESKACTAAGGTAAHTDTCNILCTVPIAPAGKVAGYDRHGFKILPSAGADEFCAAVISPVQEACDAVNGTTRRAGGCAVLCSLPF